MNTETRLAHQELQRLAAMVPTDVSGNVPLAIVIKRVSNAFGELEAEAVRQTEQLGRHEGIAPRNWLDRMRADMDRLTKRAEDLLAEALRERFDAGYRAGAMDARSWGKEGP